MIVDSPAKIKTSHVVHLTGGNFVNHQVPTDHKYYPERCLLEIRTPDVTGNSVERNGMRWS